MAYQEVRYENTLPGHNKEYTIRWDLDTNTVTSTWGPIGGHMTVRVQEHRSASSARITLDGKMERRERRGYTLIYDKHVADEVDAEAEMENAAFAPAAPLPPIVTMGRYDFDQDLRDLNNAVRLHTR